MHLASLVDAPPASGTDAGGAPPVRHRLSREEASDYLQERWRMKLAA